jgi:hypothetical protein
MKTDTDPKEPYWKRQPLVQRLRLLQTMCSTDTSREVAEQCIAMAEERTVPPSLIEAGWKCSNAAMVLHDHYRANGDKENAEICKKVAREWREALGNDDGRVESFIDPGGKES